jgi:hypothetical protein
VREVITGVDVCQAKIEEVVEKADLAEAGC